MKSYVKIFGPNLFDALKKIEEVFEKDPAITGEGERIPMEPVKLISELKKKETVLHNVCPDWTISFVWKQDPNIEEVINLIDKIDNALLDLKARYTITTVSDPLAPPEPEAVIKLPSDISEKYAITYLKFYGPPIAKGIKIMPEIIEKWPKLSEGKLVGKQTGPQLGVFDYALIWRELPSAKDLQDFLTYLDNKMTEINLMYNVVTRSYGI